MRLTWNGHACFTLEVSRLTIVTDPFDERCGFPMPSLRGDVVTLSHHHSDHDHLASVLPPFEVVESSCAKNDVIFTAIPSFHDKVQGAQRGSNRIFVIQADGLRAAHLGDLGCGLSGGQLEELGHVDVLMIPVGGFYTIDAAEAAQIVRQLRPSYVFPMHYKTAKNDFTIDPIGPFLEQMKELPVLRPGHSLDLPARPPEKTQIVLLDYLP